MNVDMKREPNHSQEFEIDLTVEDLLGKIISGAITGSEEALYHELLIQRSRLMRPRSFDRISRRRLAA